MTISIIACSSFLAVVLQKVKKCFANHSAGLRGEEPGALFYPRRKGSKVEARPMTDQAVLDI